MRDRPWVLALGAVATLLVLLGPARGTQARWAESEALPGTGVRTGVLDVRVDGQDALGLPALAGTGLEPGASLSEVVTVANVGTAPLTWTRSSSGTDADGHHLAAALEVGWHSAAGGSCGAALPAGARSLAPGESETVCLRLALPAAAPASVAGSSTRVTFAVDAADGGWTDRVPVQSGVLSTVALTAPQVTCLPLTMTWTAVTGATAYQLVDATTGTVLDTVGSGTLSQVLGGLFGTIRVRAVFGSSSWVSAPSASCG